AAGPEGPRDVGGPALHALCRGSGLRRGAAIMNTAPELYRAKQLLVSSVRDGYAAAGGRYGQDSRQRLGGDGGAASRGGGAAGAAGLRGRAAQAHARAAAGPGGGSRVQGGAGGGGGRRWRPNRTGTNSIRTMRRTSRPIPS